MAGRGSGNASHVPDLAGVRLAEGYEILAPLSAGRVATVYEARRRDGQRVVVKVLLPQFSTSRRHVERFLEAARVGASLSHPNIAAVFDCGRVPGGAVYFARAYLEGERLRRSLAERGAIHWAQAKPLLAQLLEALAAAHQQGVTHGGLEPARCWLVGGHGDPARSQLMLTGFGMFGGPRDPWPAPAVYRAPELEHGSSPSPSTDVFGAGALAYALLSGAALAKAHHGRSTGLCELVPDVPVAVDGVIARALHPDPGHRHPEGTALLADFLEALGLASTTEPQVAPLPRVAASAAAASFRYPPPPSVVPTPVLGRHPTFAEDDEDESTTVHPGVELESPSPIGVHAAATEGTVRLAGPQPVVEAREETVLLASAELPAANRRTAELDAGWGTVVLPGGGHPQHFAERTQLLAVDEPASEPSAAISLTTMLSVSLGAPEPVRAVHTATLTGMGGAQLDESGASTAMPGRTSPGPASVAIPMPVRGPVGAPGAWPIPRVGAPAPPAGGYPVVSGPYPVISGAYPVVSPSGGTPMVPRPSPRGRARPGGAPTGSHRDLRPSGDETTRLAWGFLLGVLLAVGILGGAVALAMFVSS